MQPDEEAARSVEISSDAPTGDRLQCALVAAVHVTSVQAGIPDWGNIESLSKIRFEYHTQGVVWHDGY